MWATVAGVLGISVVLAAAETLYRDMKNRPPPPERLESKDFKASEADVKASKRYEGFAKDILGRLRNFKK